MIQKIELRDGSAFTRLYAEPSFFYLPDDALWEWTGDVRLDLILENFGSRSEAEQWKLEKIRWSFRQNSKTFTWVKTRGIGDGDGTRGDANQKSAVGDNRCNPPDRLDSDNRSLPAKQQLQSSITHAFKQSLCRVASGHPFSAMPPRAVLRADPSNPSPRHQPWDVYLVRTFSRAFPTISHFFEDGRGLA